MTDVGSDNIFPSSIKIKGLHFLPPVITTKRRLELQKYKHQAIKLERRLQTCRDLRRNLQELLILKPYSEFCQSSESDSVAETESCASKPLCTKHTHAFSALNSRSNLRQDILEVTEYGRDGIKIIGNKYNVQDSKTNDLRNSSRVTNNSNNSEVTNNINVEFKTKSPPTETDESILRSIETNLNTLQNVSPSSNLSSPFSPISHEQTCSPPRLIRSNSYILENPSPILLAHLDKLCQNDDGRDGNQINKKSLEHARYVPFENSQFNSISTVYDASENNEWLNVKVDSNFNNKLDNVTSPKIEVIQTDLSVQHITLDCDKNTCEEVDLQKSSLELVDPNCQLMEMLKSIPDDFSNKILDLIEKQVEQNYRNNVKNCSINLNKEGISEKNNSDSSSSIVHNDLCKIDVNEHKSDNDGFSMSPSQSIYYTLSASTCTVLPTSPNLIDDLVVETIMSDSEKENSKVFLVKDSPIKYSSLENSRRKLNFKQKAYQQLDDLTIIKQEWAASVIGAHVRGYLTRRLLRTERVQSLINTIKDALICALQLQTVDNIDESDVELHRRLINQVTAACYTFHDIFFSTSVPEQMNIISNDRQKKLEKAKRPASAPGPRQNRSATNVKHRTSLSQSLTKV